MISNRSSIDLHPKSIEAVEVSHPKAMLSSPWIAQAWIAQAWVAQTWVAQTWVFWKGRALMAIGEPEKSPIDVWIDRVWRSVYIVMLSLAYLIVFSELMVPHRILGLCIAPFVVVLYWRLVSYWICGTQFDIQLTTQPKDSSELISVIFTILAALNLIVFVYHLISWYEVVAQK